MYKKAQSLQPWLSEVYRGLHEIPELDRDLPETRAFIASALDRMGISWRPCAGGLLAELPGRKDGPLLALRADMDALPVTEATGLPFASKHAGRMHACGHDAHVTCALGALKLLGAEDRGASLRVLFQPAEETDGGAEKMIAEGALNGVSAALCLHVAAGVRAGQIAVISGRARASSNMFNVTLRGRGSHGAYPHLGVDAVSAGAQILAALQTLVSRETDPLDSAVVTVGKFTAGTARNVIPDEARLEGILRTLDPKTREQSCRRIREIAEDMARALRVTAEVEMIAGYPALINDGAMAAEIRRIGAGLLGAGNVLIPEAAQMGVDDFAYIGERVPGCYVDLGCSSALPAEPIHSPRFRVDESCLPVGAALIAAWVQK